MDTTADTTQVPLDAQIGAPRKPLTAFDRCDACGAQAYVAAIVNGSELLYCAHHGNEYETNLFRLATAWHDERLSLSVSTPAAA